MANSKWLDYEGLEYYTKKLDAKLEDYAKTSDLSNYVTSSTLSTELGAYLPLTGGTLTGDLKVDAKFYLKENEAAEGNYVLSCNDDGEVRMTLWNELDNYFLSVAHGGTVENDVKIKGNLNVGGATTLALTEKDDAESVVVADGDGKLYKVPKSEVGGGDYLPLSGGTLTGDLTVNGTTRLNAASVGDASRILVSEGGAVRSIGLLDLVNLVKSYDDCAIEFTAQLYDTSAICLYSGDTADFSDDDNAHPDVWICISGSDCDVEVDGTRYENVFGGSDTGKEWQIPGITGSAVSTVRVIPKSDGARIWSNPTNRDTEYSRNAIVSVRDWGRWKWADCSYLSQPYGNYCRLESVCADRWGAFSEVTTFSYCFRNCSRLTSIPADLFANCTKVTDFSYCFSNCTGLTSIPENLFAGCTAVTTFQYCFYNCSKLTSLPENLFAGCTAVTTFYYCFYGCTGLTSLPENLFASCTAVTTFQYCFYNCSKLTSLPENLFAGCTAVTSFSYCFNSGSSSTHNLTGESAFDRVYIDGVETVIHLYERENYPDLYTKPTSTSYCYRYQEKLDDYDSIPSGWK